MQSPLRICFFLLLIIACGKKDNQVPAPSNNLVSQEQSTSPTYKTERFLILPDSGETEEKNLTFLSTPQGMVLGGDILILNADEISLTSTKSTKSTKSSPIVDHLNAWLIELWPLATIPYEISDELKQTAATTQSPVLTYLQQAIDLINQKTKVSFVPKTNEHNQYLRVSLIHSKYGVATIGYKALPENETDPVFVPSIWIKMDYGVQDILHQLGHTLGRVHEENRPDRDEYIDVFPELMDQNCFNLFLFTFQSEWNTKYDYDYSSMMHSPEKTCALDPNGLPTLRPKRPKDRIEYSPNKISPIDISNINYMYRYEIAKRDGTPVAEEGHPSKIYTPANCPGQDTNNSIICRLAYLLGRCVDVQEYKNCSQTCSLCEGQEYVFPSLPYKCRKWVKNGHCQSPYPLVRQLATELCGDMCSLLEQANTNFPTEIPKLLDLN